MTEFKFDICSAGSLVSRLRDLAAAGTPVGTVLSIEEHGFAKAERELLARRPYPSQRAQHNTLAHEGYAPRLYGLVGFNDISQRIMVFDDLENTTDVGPEPRHIKLASLVVKQHLLARAGTIIMFNCRKGISRSTAMAAVGVIQATETLGHGLPEPNALLQQVLDVVPEATPNLLVIEHADDFFGYGGRLYDTARRHPQIERNHAKRRAAARKFRKTYG